MGLGEMGQNRLNSTRLSGGCKLDDDYK